MSFCVCDMCVHICGGVCACVHMEMWQLEGAIPRGAHLPRFLRQGCSLAYSSLSRPGWLARELQDLNAPPPSTGITSMLAYPAFTSAPGI